jgi:hypothetical protein
MKKEDKMRILGRRLAQQLTTEQLKSVGGGTPTYCSAGYDDGDLPY